MHLNLLGEFNEVEVWIYIVATKKSKINKNPLDTVYS